jgi:hypothetical protein
MAFEAVYGGVCVECWGAITPGQLIKHDPRSAGYQHDQCPTEEATRRGEVCPTCRMERSLAGTCGCDD